jgi:hypothetical protein
VVARGDHVNQFTCPWSKTTSPHPPLSSGLACFDSFGLSSSTHNASPTKYACTLFCNYAVFVFEVGAQKENPRCVSCPPIKFPHPKPRSYVFARSTKWIACGVHLKRINGPLAFFWLSHHIGLLRGGKRPKAEGGLCGIICRLAVPMRFMGVM